MNDNVSTIINCLTEVLLYELGTLLKLHHYTYETTTDVVGLHQLFKKKEGNDDWISQKLIYLCKQR